MAADGKYPGITTGGSVAPKRRPKSWRQKDPPSKALLKVMSGGLRYLRLRQLSRFIPTAYSNCLLLGVHRLPKGQHWL
jgi:hypothetical protein